jgi:hypothetical protein
VASEQALRELRIADVAMGFADDQGKMGTGATLHV